MNSRNIYVSDKGDGMVFFYRRERVMRREHSASVVVRITIEDDGEVRIECPKNRLGETGSMVLKPEPR